MKKTILLACIAILWQLTTSVYAQPPCGFDEVHNKLLKTDPVFARQIEQNEVNIRRFIETHPELRSGSRPSAVVTIPVVVHVMHTGGAIGSIYNPSDAQILGAINYLNQVYAGTYPGMSAPIEGGGVVDMEIQFALAQRTPSCGTTNGINRVDASSLPNYASFGVNVNNTNGCPELTLKNFSRWNPADYYNIWIVNKLDGADGTSGQFIAGFAYFPGSSSQLDGTIMLATQMDAGEKTLPHEIGHALNLYHPFQGSANNTQCPTNSSCTTQGDRVCDTDPISNNYNAVSGNYSFACRTGANSCASPNTYSINTESNFMSYTNCYTLFTNGQKTRVQAAMSLSSRASLVSAGNLALVPCGAVINFSQSSSTTIEDNTGTVTGCRKYRDYTFPLTIGAAPSASATATLAASETAMSSLDYLLTTNGDFSNPANVITFNSGSTAAQTVSLRVFDDASVETNETLILDFTVNNGGGNAVKGVNIPTLTITISDNDLAPVGTGSATFSIGAIDSYVEEVPFDATQQRQRAQFLYKASELTAAGINAGSIQSVQFFIYNKLSTRPFSNFSIKMASTNVPYLVDASVNIVGSMTTVFSSASYSTTAGWNNFNLSTPFTWDGTSNLAIEICYDNGSPAPSNFADQVGTYEDGSSSTEGNMFFENDVNCSGYFSSISYFTYGLKPILRLGVATTGTPVETVASSTSDVHLASGSDDYFYSNNNRLLARISSINATLGCVDVTLEGAGATWVNAFGGQRSAKVFAITPTTNIASTNYTVSLYFDNTELAGKNPATIRMAKTTAASAAAANSGNTIFQTPTVSILGSGTTVFTGSFTGFSRFFLVDGLATLPLSWLTFTGATTAEKNVLLQWSVASEVDNRQFDVEVSADGIHFDYLSTVVSKGNSIIPQQYEYLHVRPASGVIWYRLKQIDIDNHFSYSKVIMVTIKSDVVRSFIYPVPAKDRIIVSFGTSQANVHLEILTSDMRLVKKEFVPVVATKKDIDVSGLPPGLYFLRLKGNTISEMMRFIKE